MPATRLTKRQRFILKTFADSPRPMTPQDAWTVARAEMPGIGVATVYRAVKQLVEDGHLNRIDVAGQTPVYEAVREGHHHHHHFFCRVCERLFEIGHCPKDIGDLVPKGFKMEDHKITIHGICRDCLKKSA